MAWGMGRDSEGTMTRGSAVFATVAWISVAAWLTLTSTDEQMEAMAEGRGARGASSTGSDSTVGRSSAVHEGTGGKGPGDGTALVGACVAALSCGSFTPHELGEALRGAPTEVKWACLDAILENAGGSVDCVRAVAFLREAHPLPEAALASIAKWARAPIGVPFRDDVVAALARGEAASQALALELAQEEWEAFARDPEARREFSVRGILACAVDGQQPQWRPLVSKMYMGTIRLAKERPYDDNYKRLDAGIVDSIRKEARLTAIALDLSVAVAELRQDLEAPMAAARPGLQMASNALARSTAGPVGTEVHEWLIGTLRGADPSHPTESQYAASLAMAGYFGPEFIQDIKVAVVRGGPAQIRAGALMGLAEAVKRTGDSEGTIILLAAMDDWKWAGEEDAEGKLPRHLAGVLAERVGGQSLRRLLAACDQIGIPAVTAALDHLPGAVLGEQREWLYGIMRRFGDARATVPEFSDLRRRVARMLVSTAPEVQEEVKALASDVDPSVGIAARAEGLHRALANSACIEDAVAKLSESAARWGGTGKGQLQCEAYNVGAMFARSDSHVRWVELSRHLPADVALHLSLGAASVASAAGTAELLKSSLALCTTDDHVAMVALGLMKLYARGRSGATEAGEIAAQAKARLSPRAADLHEVLRALMAHD